MHVYLAGEVSLSALERTGVYDAFFKSCTHRLFSYFYHDNADSEEIKTYVDKGVNLFLDSGAFSAFTKDKIIDIEAYAEYVKACPFYYPVANLDVIGDTGKASFDNMVKLRDLVGQERLMPVFHQSDDDEWLDKILDMGFDYIALGGLVGSSWEKMSPWLNKTWARLVDKDGKPKLKVHGFGLTAIRALLAYPWYSVDSSSWMQSSIYGNGIFLVNKKLMGITFSEQNPDRRDIDSRHYECLPAAHKARIDALLDEIGVTAKQASEHWVPRSIINAHTFGQLGQLAPETYQPAQQTLF